MRILILIVAPEPRLPREAGVLRAKPAEPPRAGIASGPSV